MKKYLVKIEIEYDDERGGEPCLDDLHNNISRAIGEGLLTPSYQEHVEEFSIEIDDA